MLLQDAGIPKRTITALNKKNIYTTYDLLRWVPRKYKDYTEIISIDEAVSRKEESAVKLHFSQGQIEGEYGRGLRYVAYLIDEESGNTVKAVWFGNTYVSKFYKFLEGKNVIVCGKFTKNEDYGYQIVGPDRFELAEDFAPKMEPVLKKIKGVSESTLKTLIYKEIKRVNEPIDTEVYEQFNLSDVIPLKEALFKVFYPKSREDVNSGRYRLLLDDLLHFAIDYKKNEVNATDGFVFNSSSKAVNFVNSLPFELTDDQKATLNYAVLNAKHGKRNDLLVQGDVGCGKTVIAFTSMVNAVENGYQAALVAPTQVLASQHYEELKMRLKNEDVAFIHSGLKAKEKKVIINGLKDGSIKYAVGTHSIFNKDVEFKNLGVIVTDEEHRFGVKQKEALKQKAQAGVHVIKMSATPIPRTLVSYKFGESTKVCNIKSMPKGRKPIITRRQLHHTNTYELIRKELLKDHQCYVVCPAIGKEEDIDEYTEDEEMKSVLKAYANYESHFKNDGFKIAVLHGKMKKDEITETINAFQRNEIQILISTTVIEVGVNVPNATVMVVEEAERFGLATLHQLRGRVGRSSLQSYCILISEDARNNERLIAMEEHTSGFEIAEIDLSLRGSGNLIGTKQSGDDKYINLILDNKAIFEQIKLAADYCIANDMADIFDEMYEQVKEAA